jgi:hypothetical protein
LTQILAGAFLGCTSLAEITVPESVTVLGNYAFYGCSSLKKAVVENPDVLYEKDVFFGTPSDFVLYGNSDSATEAYASENNHRFRSLDAPAYVTGDVTGNGSVDISDAVLLFQHSMIPDIYHVTYPGSMDFTNDGSLDIDDAVLLFQHSMIPDLYPIR